MNEIKGNYEDIFIKPVSVIDLYKFEGDDISHVLLNAVTRQGKSTLLRNMTLRYIEYGYTVLWREVGKYDFISRFQNTQDVIDHYESKHYTQKDKQKKINTWKKYQNKFGDEFVVCIDHPDNIQQNKVNILLYDLIDGITNRELVIIQYYEFFKILRNEREHNFEEYDLVVMLDEANTIMPTYNKLSIHRNTLKKIQDMIFWLTQWAGYHVRWVMSTHIIFQLNKDARGQCGLLMFKRSEQKDVKDVMQHHLFHLEDDEFFKLYEQIKQIPKNQVLYIDKENKHDILDVFWTPKKYEQDECRDFVDQFELYPIVKPIERNWDTVKTIATHLVDNLTEEIEDKIFYVGYDEKEGKAKLKMKLHQLYDYVFSFEEYKALFGDHEFFKEYLVSGVLVEYENTNAQEKLMEKDFQAEMIRDIRVEYKEGSIDIIEAFIKVFEIDDSLSNKRLAELFDLRERGVNGSPKYRLLYNDFKHTHNKLSNDTNLSLLEYYRSIKDITVEETKTKVSPKIIKKKSKRRKQ